MNSRFMSLAVMSLLMTGCVSMDAVTKYSAYSKDTVDSINVVARDYALSCARSNSYKALSEYNDCVDAKKGSKAIIDVSKVLSDYSDALGALASDEIVDYNTNIDKVVAETKNIKGYDEGKVSSLKKLSGFVGQMATNFYRQKQISEVIMSANLTVVKFSDDLAQVIDENIVFQYDNELETWRQRYQYLERSQRSSNPFVWEGYSKNQWDKRIEIETKLAAAKSLANGVREIGKTHNKLSKDAGDLSGKEVYAAVRAYVNQAKPILKEVQEAFSTNKGD